MQNLKLRSRTRSYSDRRISLALLLAFLSIIALSVLSNCAATRLEPQQVYSWDTIRDTAQKVFVIEG